MPATWHDTARGFWSEATRSEHIKIGILGAGNIGGTLGKHWAAAGHAVRFGVRSPGDSKYSQELSDDAQIVSMADALAFGDVILVAVPGKVVADVAAEYGTKLNGKIVIDATNQPGQAEMNSLRVLVQSAPQAKFCRAFNTLGWENFAQPTLNGAPIDLFYCGAAAAKEPLATLITDAPDLRRRHRPGTGHRQLDPPLVLTGPQPGIRPPHRVEAGTRRAVKLRQWNVADSSATFHSSLH